MPSLYAPSTSSSSDTAASSLYPGLVGNEQHVFQQQQQQHLHQHHFQQQQYTPPHAQQFQGAGMSAAPASTMYQGSSMSVDAATMYGLQALYPNSPHDVLMKAALQPHPPTPMGQAAASYSQPPSHQAMYGAQSDHTLANTLAFTRPSPVPAHTTPNSMYGLPQSAAPAPLASSNLASAPPPSGLAPQVNVSTPDGSSHQKSTATKLRQSKLNFLPGIASSVGKEAPPSIPAPVAIPPAQVVPDTASEPSTPPIPPAKALATKATVGGASSSNGAAKAKAAAPATADSLLWNKAKQPLSRLSVERSPEASACQLVQMLCEVDSDGKFRKPISTGAEVRKTILETMNAIATLEKGRGFTEHGRKKFFGTWMSIPGGRHIFATWLKQTVPPKKVSEGNADMSRRYKETLMPLLSILDFVDIKKAYLTDEAGLGKAITGVSLRAVDTTARKLAEKLKIKWTKIIDAEDSTSATNARPVSTTATIPAASATSAMAKRKPSDSSVTSEASTKRYKSAASVASTASSTRTTATTKSTTASSTTANAKPGLSFFGSGTAVKKPAISSSSSSSTGSSRAGPGSSAIGSAGRMNAHQSVMSLMDKLSGGNGSDRAAAGRDEREGSSVSAQERMKVKKRVTWKDDRELVAVKLIEPADYGQDDEEYAETAAQTAAVDGHDEGLALRQSVSTMEAQMDWREPKEVMVPMIEYDPIGSESVEGPFQTQRNAQLEEKVYEEGTEPDCPDESQLNQPGSISETPEELKGFETKEIPTPWLDEEEDTANEVEQAAPVTGEGEVKIENGPSATPIDVGALLANIKPVLSATNGATTSSLPATSALCASGSTAAAPPNFDANQIKSLLDATKGSGPNSNAVNAAMASQNVTSGNLSALLASFSSSVNGAQATAPQAGGSGVNGGGWDQGQRGYDAYGAGANHRVEESYPGEYNQDYTQSSSQPASHYGAPSQRYGQPSRSYNSQYGWDTDGPSNYGGASAPNSHTKPCKFFAQGSCFRGDACRFRHG
ncbi:hypothetical protein NDA16_003684 [Ustilago loliicola]|nr:hypothetical protein NDA16_003684 [Ustilago loliicola]